MNHALPCRQVSEQSTCQDDNKREVKEQQTRFLQLTTDYVDDATDSQQSPQGRKPP